METSQRSWATVAVLIGAGAAVALQIGKVPAALPFLQAELGLTLIQSGWVVAIFSAVAAGFAIFLGAASDRVGPLAAALAGMLLSAISGIAGGFVSGGTLLLLSRVFEGLGFIFTTTSIPSLIVMVVSARDRKASLAIWGMYMPLGSGVMLALSGPLLYFFEWRVLWWATSALILAAMIPMFMFGKRIATDASARALRPKFSKSIRASLRRGPIMLSAIFAIYAALYLTVVGFLPSILIGVDRFTPISAATVGAVASLFNVLGNGLSGWLHNRRFQFLPLVLTGCAGMAVFGSCVFLPDIPGVWRVISAAGFCGFAGLVPSTIFSELPNHAPHHSALATISALLVQGSAIGQLLGPPLVAATVDWYGAWTGAVPLMLLGATSTAVCAVFLTASGRRDLARSRADPNPSQPGR